MHRIKAYTKNTIQHDLQNYFLNGDIYIGRSPLLRDMAYIYEKLMPETSDSNWFAPIYIAPLSPIGYYQSPLALW